MKLAVFDLDHTLVAMDTNEAWLLWLAANSGLRIEPFMRDMERYTIEYDEGRLDIEEFMAFQLGILAKFRRPFLERVKKSFIEEWMRHCLPQRSVDLVHSHKAAGDICILSTATYTFVSSAVGELFGVDHNIACIAETDEKGEFTGRLVDGTSYGPAKVERMERFLATPEAHGLSARDVVFYSDSAVDLPMFNFTDAAGGECVAVNPSKDLEKEAISRGWRIIENYDATDLKRAMAPAAGFAKYPEIFHV